MFFQLQMAADRLLGDYCYHFLSIFNFHETTNGQGVHAQLGLLILSTSVLKNVDFDTEDCLYLPHMINFSMVHDLSCIQVRNKWLSHWQITCCCCYPKVEKTISFFFPHLNLSITNVFVTTLTSFFLFWTLDISCTVPLNC